MIKTFAVIEYTEGISKRNHNKAANFAFRKTMEHHVEFTLAKHFAGGPETMPGGAYGYAPRREKYNAWKRKRFGHDKPLVRFGNLARRILSQKTSGVTATAKGARARLKHGLKFAKIIRRREIEAITPQERREIAKDIKLRYLSESIKYPIKRRKEIT